MILGATLLLATLFANIPSSVLASGPMCTLQCCAGRAPHVAGSCMDGSCQASLMSRFHTIHNPHKLPGRLAEELCDSRLRTTRATNSLTKSIAPMFGISSEQLRGSTTPEAARMSTTVLGKPCQPDCGAGTFSFGGQSRPRESSATSYVDKPRPPSAARFGHDSFNLANALDELCRRSRPRGPPFFPTDSLI
jgi:hypothetical protein